MKIARLATVYVALFSIPAAFAVTQEEVLGLWRTASSSHEGAKPSGAVFRKDGTGEFISPNVQAQASKEMRDMLEKVTQGSTNQQFTYRVNGGTLELEVVAFGGVPVIRQDPTRFDVQRTGNILKLIFAKDTSRWLLLEKLAAD